MFIKSLIISTPEKEIRNITFKQGVNLIVDNTPTIESELTKTGNNVGKTTVLKLIDFCLGANPKVIYTETENNKSIYKLVQNYLISNEVLVTLTLINNFEEKNPKSIVIKRNFLSRNKAILRINEKDISKKDFEKELLKLLIPDQKNEKPSFRQIISHNIRYKDENINQTLKTLNKFTTDIEYECLYLFLLNCSIDNGELKQHLNIKLTQEKNIKERLERKQSKNAYQQALSIIDNDIYVLNSEKNIFRINKNFEKDVESFNFIKYEINKCSTNISQLNIKKELIEQAKEDLEKNVSKIDLEQLKLIYQDAKINISGIQKTFEELVTYHNEMLVEKVNFISEDLPSIIKKIKKEREQLESLLKQEKKLSSKFSNSIAFKDHEKIITELNDKYRTKGEIESIIGQLDEVDKNIADIEKKLANINEYMFSKEFEEKVQNQVKKFNKYFSFVSKELYDESYFLSADIQTNAKTNQKYYKFSVCNTNMSSGKKQGEILCFDFAYTLFSDFENKNCLHFLLNDKKELMHDNQLIKMTDFIKDKNIQVIISILKDKVPEKILNEVNISIKLSPNDKLFKIENQKLE